MSYALNQSWRPQHWSCPHASTLTPKHRKKVHSVKKRRQSEFPLQRMYTLINKFTINQCFYCSQKYDHVTPLLRDVLHWLPVPFRIEYKLCLLIFQSLHGAALKYLRDCCTATHSSASGLRLRSLERIALRVRRMNTHFGDHAFSAAGPRCWNSLPPVIV